MIERIVILGNSGSGKTTAARRLVAERGLVHLDLDAVAFGETPGERRPVAESVEAMKAFRAEHAAWVMEGSYASLAEAALPWCTEFWFLNPGVERCVQHCLARPWEPEKYESAEAQNENLTFLLEWVRSYDTRTDEYGLAAHRSVFDGFEGCKREIEGLEDMSGTE